MRALQNFDRFFTKNVLWITLICVALGVILPDFFGKFVPYTIGLFAFLTFDNSLNAGFSEVKNVFFHPAPILVIMGLLHIVMPLLALGASLVFFPDNPNFITGMVLEFAVPAGISALLWVSISQANNSLCLSVVLLDTLLAPITIPMTLKLLIGSVVKIDTTNMMIDLMFMVAIPALLAMTLYQITKGRSAQVLKPYFDPLGKIAMVLIACSNATSVAPFLRNLTPTLVLVLVVVLVVSTIGYLLGYVGARLLKLNFPSTMTMTLNTGIRNINAGAVLAGQYFPGEVMFPVIISVLFLQLSAAVVIKILQHTPQGRAALGPEDTAPPPLSE